MTVLIVDNYDSFTYNLYQYLGELGADPVVERNDAIDTQEIERRGYSHIVLSPGPGSPDRPRDFGVSAQVILELASKTPVLGVCLGHQGIIHHLGGKVVRAPEIVHGKTSTVRHDHSRLFSGLAPEIEVMRYHSLIGVDIPECLNVTAYTAKDRLVMAVEHKSWPLYGIQFHPESIGTPDGKTILANFLRRGAKSAT